jgi:hypothetical protein
MWGVRSRKLASIVERSRIDENGVCTIAGGRPRRDKQMTRSQQFLPVLIIFGGTFLGLAHYRVMSQRSAELKEIKSRTNEFQHRQPQPDTPDAILARSRESNELTRLEGEVETRAYMNEADAAVYTIFVFTGLYAFAIWANWSSNKRTQNRPQMLPAGTVSDSPVSTA